MRNTILIKLANKFSSDTLHRVTRNSIQINLTQTMIIRYFIRQSEINCPPMIRLSDFLK